MGGYIIKKKIEFSSNIKRIVESTPNQVTIIFKSENSEDILKEFERHKYKVSRYGKVLFSNFPVKVTIERIKNANRSDSS